MTELRRILNFKWDDRESAEQTQQEYLDLMSDGDIDLISLEGPSLQMGRLSPDTKLTIVWQIIVEYVIINNF